MEKFSWNLKLSNVESIYLLSLWMLIPIIVPFLISQFSTPIYQTRYTITASLAFYILAAKGISNIGIKYVKIGVIIIIILFSFYSVEEYYFQINKDQWREATNYMDANANSGDLIIFNSAFNKYAFDYYSKRIDVIKKPFTEKTSYIDEENIKELGPTVYGHNRVWLLLSNDHDNKGLIKKTLNESFNLSDNRKYVGIDISLFIRK